MMMMMMMIIWLLFFASKNDHLFCDICENSHSNTKLGHISDVTNK